MSPIYLNLFLFALIVIVFAGLGFSASRRASSTKDYFHNDHLRKNVVSLTATNLTLGTGLVYFVSGAQQTGLLMLLPIAGVWFGYWLLGWFLEKTNVIAARTGKNFLDGVDEAISQSTGRPSPFSKAISVCLVFIFVLVLAFEIFASSKVISPFLFSSPSPTVEALLSMVIFAVTLTYALLGGIKAIFGVDVVQVPLILLFLPVFFFTGIPELNHPSMIANRLADTFKTDAVAITAAVIALIASVATQFYSILNWGAVSNVAMHHQRTLLNRVGALTSAALLLFVLVGLLHPTSGSGSAWSDLMNHYSLLSSRGGPSGYFVSAVMMLGMASILLTTTDAVVVNAVLFWYDNVTKKNSKSASDDRSELRKIRQIGAVAFGMCFLLLALLNYLQPDPFYLLLSIAGGVSVFAPMIACAGWLASRQRRLSVFTPAVVYCFVGLFVVAGLVSILLLTLRSSAVSFVSICAFALSAALSAALMFRANRLPRAN